VRQSRRALLCAAVFGLLLPRAAGAVQSDDGNDQALLADADYAVGLTAIKAGEFAAALSRLHVARKRFPEAANLHNELGYSYRKLGQFDQAFEHYKRALAIDPRHRGAHEYIGEAYLLVGDVASAEKHLAALRAICLLPCDELSELQRAIEARRAQDKPR